MKFFSGKNFIILSVLAVAGIVIYFSFARKFFYHASSDFYKPYVTAAEKIESATEEKTLYLDNKSEIITELLKLKKENRILSSKLSVMSNLRKENEELRNLLGINQLQNFNTMMAEIIVRDPARWYHKFVIDKGSKDGIEEGSVILAEIPGETSAFISRFAVIGRVASVSNHSSIVSTILSEDCSLSVMLSGSSAAGITYGGEKSGKKFSIKIKYLPRDIPYVAGESVVTSGLSKFTPHSLLVGRLSGTGAFADVLIRDNLYAESWLEPSADFDNLHFVIVLVPEK